MVALNKENNRTEEIEERVDKKQKFRQVDRQVLKNITQSVLSTNFHVHDIINNHYDSFIFKNQAKRSGNTNDIKTPVVWGGTLCGNKKHDDLNKETTQGNTLSADFFIMIIDY